ncbi:hypothetical protein [Streptomyces sp. Ru73]|uniref:hypothetical protein n=1 Tax=Streptomyces sp. Ru73 TaxID=2080748 RepID=UPI0011B044A7|nr:hypothetical protein [Streptomyces sp. Ru73]
MLHWLFFGVGFGVLPIGLGYVMNSFTHRGVSLSEILSRGELLIVTTSLAAAAAGQIITRSGSGLRNIVGFLAFSNIAMACVTAGLFAFVTSAPQMSQKLDEGSVTGSSLVLFFATFVTAGASTFIAEWEQA